MKNSLNDYENCYTLIEIITGLRSEYQISRNLLDRLKNYIKFKIRLLSKQEKKKIKSSKK